MFTDCLRGCRIRLSRHEERRLASAMRRGDLAARNQLIESQLPYVARLAAPFVRPHVPLEDLVQVGVLILIRVLKKFRPSRGRLTTFCTMPVRSAFIHYSSRQRTVIRRTLNRPAPHLSPQWDQALQVTALEDADTQSLAVAGDVPPSLTDLDEHLARIARLEAAIDELDPRLARVIRGRLAGLRLKDLGAELGLSRERVRQLELQALSTLRRRLTEGRDA